MQLRRVGRSGLEVSRIGLGTMTWGADTDEYDAADQLTAFRDAGGTLIDTAPIYGNGACEPLLGTLLAKAECRDDIVLAGKAGFVRRGGSIVKDGSRRGLLAQLDRSLRDLGTDHLDLWQIHSPDTSVPLEESLAALEHAVATGRTRYVGISNFTAWQTAFSHTWLAARAAALPLISNQVEYSLVNRDPEDEVVDAAEYLGMGLFAWSPLGRGVLTGKYRAGTPGDSRGAQPGWDEFVGQYLTPERSGTIEAWHVLPTVSASRWVTWPWRGCSSGRPWPQRSSAPARRISSRRTSAPTRSSCRGRSWPHWMTSHRRSRGDGVRVLEPDHRPHQVPQRGVPHAHPGRRVPGLGARTAPQGRHGQAHRAPATQDHPSAQHAVVVEPRQAAIETYRYLRVGIVALALLLALAVVGEIVVGDAGLLGSISAYYFTPVRDVFVGVLVALGLGLIVIRGRGVEDVLLNLAGMLAPVVAFVPTPVTDSIRRPSDPRRPPRPTRCGRWSLSVCPLWPSRSRPRDDWRATHGPRRWVVRRPVR